MVAVGITLFSRTNAIHENIQTHIFTEETGLRCLDLVHYKQIDEFIDELRHRSQFAHGNAADVLGKMGKQAAPALIDALNSKHIKIRRYALGRIGNSTAVPTLKTASCDAH